MSTVSPKPCDRCTCGGLRCALRDVRRRHVRVGIGRLVDVLSAPMLRELVGPGPWIAVGAADLAAASTARIALAGPCDDLVAEAAALFTAGSA
jgi:hypothetical protein